MRISVFAFALLLLPATVFGGEAVQSGLYSLQTASLRKGDFNNFHSTEQWPKVLKKLEAEQKMLDECAANPASASACTVAATKFLKVVEKGRGLIGLSLLLAINRAVNESLQEKTDLEQWGEVERWSTPLETFDTGYGDCEDYAIAKYVALKRLGVRDENLGIVLIETNITNENHAILAVGASGTRYLLNNGWGGWWGPAEDVSSKNIRPLLIHDSRGGRRFTTQLASKAK